MTRTAIFCISLALVLNMAGYLSVAAILPQLLTAWNLSETEVAWLASCHMGVYAIAAVVLLPLTDRIDPKTIILCALVCGVAGGFGFAWAAVDFWSGFFFRSLVGVAQAGVYMPGLKLIADALEGHERSRATALYASMVPIGSGMSLLLPVVMPTASGWGPMFELTGAACLAALAFVAFFVPRAKPAPRLGRTLRHPFNFAGVLRNVDAMRIVLSYAGHVWETFGFRTWIVAFLIFASLDSLPSSVSLTDITVFAGVIVIAAMPASILVGRWRVAYPRVRVLRWVSLSSLVLSIAMATIADGNLYVVMAFAAIYGIIGFADQGALGSAIVDAAEPEYRGATLAIYTLFGFGFGMLGAVMCGVALEVAGGIGSAEGWRALWLTCGIGSLAMTLLLSNGLKKVEAKAFVAGSD